MITHLNSIVNKCFNSHTGGFIPPLIPYNRSSYTPSIMSVLHHEELQETCYETAVEEFCTSNKLTPEMFAQIENHDGVQIAIIKRAYQIWDDLCQ